MPVIGYGHTKSARPGATISEAEAAGVDRFAQVHEVMNHDLLLVSKLLGHSSVETTQIYVAMPDSRLRVGLDAVTLAG